MKEGSEKEQDNTGKLVSLTKAVVFEKNAEAIRRECPSLYVYLKTFHGIIQGRGQAHRIPIAGRELYQYIHDEWMKDTPVVHAVNAMMGEPDYSKLDGVFSCAS